MKFKITLLALSMLLLAPVVQADTPAQLSVPNKNLPEGDVTGVRLNALYGRTHSVKGINFSVLGLSDTDTFQGLNIGLFFGANHTRKMMTGLEIGFANWNDGDAIGADIGLANYTANHFKGLQFGFFNYVGSLDGLQIGFINATDHINKGIQIGLINYDKSGTFVSKDVPIFPIINARF